MGMVGYGEGHEMNRVQSSERCRPYQPVTSHYLEGCGQPAWRHPTSYTGVDRDTDLS